MKNIIKHLKQTNASFKRWLQSRPLLMACMVTGLSAVVVAELAAVDILFIKRYEPFDWLFFAYHVCAIVVVVALWLSAAKMRKAVSVVLAAALLFWSAPVRANEPPPPEPLPLCVIGFVALVIGGIGIIGCRIGKAGAKVAKGRTNAWPEELRFQVAEQPHSCGAVFSVAATGYCPEERSAPRVPVVFTLTIVVESATNATTTMKADVGEHYVQALPQFRDELAAHGLELVSGPGRLESFSHNGHPVFAEQVPITFDWNTSTATVHGGGVFVTVEASDDLSTWTPLLRVNVAPGSTLEVADASEIGMQFYRVSTQEP